MIAVQRTTETQSTQGFSIKVQEKMDRAGFSNYFCAAFSVLSVPFVAVR